MSAAEALLLRDGNLVQEGASEKGDMDTPTRAQLAAEGEDADEAFARLCAEQERAFYLAAGGSFAGAGGMLSDVGSPVDGAGDGAPGGELDEDEAFARGLAEAEARDWNERMLALAGVPPGGDLPPDEEEELEEDGVDVDAMSYEELLALGDAAGHVSRGLAAALIAALPRSAYAGAGQSGEQCAVCREEFQTGEEVATLPCRHFFHAQCAEPWLKLQKVCPCCKAELTPGKLRQA